MVYLCVMKYIDGHFLDYLKNFFDNSAIFISKYGFLENYKSDYVIEVRVWNVITESGLERIKCQRINREKLQ